MNDQNVTNHMEWINEYWDIIALTIVAGLKLMQDHFTIKSLVGENEDRKKEIEGIEATLSDQSRMLASIDVKVDYILKAVDDNTKDIKNIHKGN